MVAGMLDGQAESMAEIMKQLPIGRLGKGRGSRRRGAVAVQSGRQLCRRSRTPVDGGSATH